MSEPVVITDHQLSAGGNFNRVPQAQRDELLDLLRAHEVDPAEVRAVAYSLDYGAHLHITRYLVDERGNRYLNDDHVTVATECFDVLLRAELPSWWTP